MMQRISISFIKEKQFFGILSIENIAEYIVDNNSYVCFMTFLGLRKEIKNIKKYIVNIFSRRYSFG